MSANPTDEFNTAVESDLQNLVPAINHSQSLQETNQILAEALASIQASTAKLLLELVGEDEDPSRIHVSHFNHDENCIPQLNMWARDDLRKELRQKVKDLTGEGNG